MPMPARKVLFWLITLASLGVAGYALVAYLAFTPGSTVHPQMRATYAQQRVGILMHVVGSSLTLLLGPWQFVPGVRRRYAAAHRAMGRVYLGVGVLLGGGAGLYMAFHSYGGWLAHSGFAVLALAWLYTGFRAFTAVRARDFDSHRAWMIRNFAMALAAVTLRVQLGACAAAGLAFDTYYPWLAWTSWVPNLIVAELLVRCAREPSVPMAR
jgi:hypothetical protein